VTFWNKISNAFHRIPLWLAGVTVGVLFLAIGIWGEQLEDIYRKAVMICLECIGIG